MKLGQFKSKIPLAASTALSLALLIVLIVAIQYRRRRPRQTPPIETETEESGSAVPTWRPYMERGTVDVYAKKYSNREAKRVTIVLNDPRRLHKLWFVWDPNRLNFTMPILSTTHSQSGVRQVSVEGGEWSNTYSGYRQILVSEPELLDTVFKVEISMDSSSTVGFLYYSYLIYMGADGQIRRLSMPPFIVEEK